MKERFSFACIALATLLLISYPLDADGQVFTDDVTVTNSQPTLGLFDDDTSGTDWYLRNDYDAGCPQCLSFMWVDGVSNQPFVIESGTVSNMLYLDSNGSVGIKTNTPSVNVDLDIWDSVPVIRLNDTDPGQGEASFQIHNNEFTIKGNTGTNIFIMDTAAPAGSLSINSAGMVGIGTTAPAEELDIRSTSPQIRLDDTSPGQGQADLGMSNNTFSLSGNTAQRIVNVDTQAPANSLVVNDIGAMGLGTTTPAGAFEVARTGENVLFVVNRTDGARCGFLAKTNQFFVGTSTPHPVLIAAGNSWVTKFNTNGTLNMSDGGSYTGTWNDASSREYKENIETLSAAEALEAFEGLNPVKYNYKTHKEEAHVGFIAEDVPDLVATNGRKNLSTMDMVAVLTKVLQEQQKANQEQQKVAQDQQKMIQDQQIAIATLSEEVKELKKELKHREAVALAEVEQ